MRRKSKMLPVAPADPFAGCERFRLKQCHIEALTASEAAVRAAIQRQAVLQAEVKADLGLPQEVQILAIQDSKAVVKMKP